MLQWDLGKILEISGSYFLTCTLHTGVELDIFTVLDGKPQNAHQVAEKIQGDTRAVEMLLNTLTAMNLLRKNNTLYENTEISQTFLSKNSPDYKGFIIGHHGHIIKNWVHLASAVKTGKSVDKAGYSNRDRENFLMGMFNIAMAFAPVVAKNISLEGRKTLLDLGGGPGTYAIHFCLENKDIKGTILDLATTEPFAKDTVKKFGLEERIDFIACNIEEEDLPGKYDVIWISHLIHSMSPEKAQSVLGKAVEALHDGGMILIQEFILNNEKSGPLFPAAFSLNMLVNTQNGQAYSEQEIRDMLIKGGAKTVERLNFSGANGSGIMKALK